MSFIVRAVVLVPFSSSWWWWYMMRMKEITNAYCCHVMQLEIHSIFGGKHDARLTHIFIEHTLLLI
jgi:hypothetical protein